MNTAIPRDEMEARARINRVARWVDEAPSTEDLYQLLATCAMQNQPEESLGEPVLAALRAFIHRDTTTPMAIYWHIIDGNIRIGLKDGALGFGLTDKGRKLGESRFGKAAKA